MASAASYKGHAVGSTGNSASTGAEIGSDTEKVALEVNVEAVGLTPTVTVALEGSLDGVNWVACRVVPHDSETVASSGVYTTVGRRFLFLKTDLGHFYRFFRAVSSANTNVTFSTTIWAEDKD